MKCPQTTVILAMSADGKITDHLHSPARFGSSQDKAHLERQIAQQDGVLFGGGTLRAYHTSLSVRTPALIEQRQAENRPPQPIQMVCSRRADFNPDWRFFQQPFPRWLLTPPEKARFWQQSPHFERVLAIESWHWPAILSQLYDFGLHKLAILGGGELVAQLLEAGCVDELWLTVCPLILGGKTAPTPVDGEGFLATHAPQLELLTVQQGGQEVFLHFRAKKNHPVGKQSE
ncbi:RibD family protein [Spirulina sp. CS-785/01]|uniref:RibD family protein n=1 Tax=Spirulina sp. CS-785/01 TaxID=3021716 RepID=UPI00232EF257|nr:RibD family protein [Spirulina sp. CS-785/01]MDB9312128.1 RibD family protein [Spirulina sp. CS-785/01]